MGNRKRVLSFISSFSTSSRDVRTIPTSGSQSQLKSESQNETRDLSAPLTATSHRKSQHERLQFNPKPTSTLQSQPSVIDVDQTTIPELQPIFTLLNDHANKLYQEGYFLKLDDQNTQCFAQLVGTVLSLWDAAELDGAGNNGEVLPKFINLTDASIKMIESLPTRSDTDSSLQNVLSISTAGKNRYLLHFNSHHSLIQWTAGIRLAMYEHATLQEAYTGALIAGKGKSLNNINSIMERSKSPSADWARVRFGAGTPWRRCWCVISPPDEKELMKHQKQWKKSPYDRSRPPTMRGVVKFYHNKKTKKVQPIATITDAFSAFAIYPQSKPLIDASTLVKVEGSIIIHSNPPSTTEGFVFVMPEVHPGVTGFEMMLRWLFPVFDTFGLYGRPGRLVAATEDIRSLMFAMPTHRRHGYLEIMDVSGLILEQGSSNWKESYWRKKMKELTEKRMIAIESDNKPNNRFSSRRGARNSLVHGRTRGVKFDNDVDGLSVKSTPFTPWAQSSSVDRIHGGARTRTDSAPPSAEAMEQFRKNVLHNRSLSETQTLDRFQICTSQVSENRDKLALTSSQALENCYPLRQKNELQTTPESLSSEDERPNEVMPLFELQELESTASPEPVAVPPAFTHAPGSLPLSKPYHSPELRQANSRMSTTTLNQLNDLNCSPNYSITEDQRKVCEDYRSTKTDQLLGNEGIPFSPSKNEPFIEKVGLNQDTSMTKLANNTDSFACSMNPNSKSSNFEPTIPQLGIQLSEISKHTFSASTEKLPITPSNQQLKPIKLRDSNPSIASAPQMNDVMGAGRKLPPDIRQPSDLSLTLDKVGSDLASSSGHFINQNIFDKISYDSQFSTKVQKSHLNYNEDESSDLSSLIKFSKSNEALRNLDRPRAGVMRTVGETNLQDIEKKRESMEFDIDFGPTLNYASPINPGILNSSSGPSILKTNLNERGSQLENICRGPSAREWSSEPKQNTPQKPVRESRMLAWNPMLTGCGNLGTQQKGLTPEDFVAQRANATPMYTHQRHPSVDALRTTASSHLNGNRLNCRSSPALHSRNGSSDFLTLTSHSRKCSIELLLPRNSRGSSLVFGTSDHTRNLSADRLSRMTQSPSHSVDLPQRPRSQGAVPILFSAGNLNTKLTSHLNAREQEQLARVTGQPLISMTSGRKTPSAGLVGALEARERDKNVAKLGTNSWAVENVIHQWQQPLHQKFTPQSSVDLQTKYQQAGMVPGSSQCVIQGQRTPHYSASNLTTNGSGWTALMPVPTGTFQHGSSISSYPLLGYCFQGHPPGRDNSKLV